MAYIELDRSAFFHNLDIIAQQTGSVDKIALVLKDNAYGHGIEPMAEMASEYGIGHAVVRNVAEAARIEGWFDDILVLAEIPEKPAETFRYTLNAMESLSRFPAGSRIEIKVDTGMHRNGVAPEQLEAAFAGAAAAGLKVEGLFTHHRSADTLSTEWYWQKACFDALKAEARLLAERFGFPPPRFHSCNSAALFRKGTFDEDIARVGIAAYGCLEMEATLPQPDLQPVMALYAERIASRTLNAGERIGYGGTYGAAEATEVSTYDVGYADGMLRMASDRYTTPGGAALLGRISMDNATFAATEERLLLFDDANAYAKAAGTIGYEVLVGMRSHIRRIVKS